MAVNPLNFAPGQVYNWQDADGKFQEIYLVGQDPRTGKWVASCNEWCMEISELDEDDYTLMELVREDGLVHQNGMAKWSKDGTLLDDKGNRSVFDDVDK